MFESTSDCFLVQGLLSTLLFETAQTLRCVHRQLTVFLQHSSASSARVCLSGLALESDRRPTRGTGVATEAGYANNFNDDDYLISLIIAGIDNLQARREHLIEQFFLRNVLNEKSSLHYLLHIQRDLNTVNITMTKPRNVTLLCQLFIFFTYLLHVHFILFALFLRYCV